MRRPGWLVVGVGGLLALALASASAASGAPAPPSGFTPTTPNAPGTTSPGGPDGTVAPNGDVILSNETTTTTWSTAIYANPVRSRPSRGAPVVARLRFTTSDGFLQSYIALRERRTPSGEWVQVRLPMRPNGRTGWVRRSDLDTYSVVHTELVLDRGAHKLTLYRGGNAVMTVPVGVGKSSTPTPPGHFWITEAFAVHGAPVYGPYAFGTSDYSTLSDWPGGGIVGMHGTNEPQLVPGNPSHGCIRLHNSDVLRLSHLVPIGTPLLIT